MSNDTQVKQEPDVERWKRELSEAGWTAASATAWYDPSGGLYRGPYGAWKELQRRNGVAVGDDRDHALAAEFVGRCKGAFPIEIPLDALTELATTFAATVRREEREAAFKEMIGAVAVLPSQGTMNYRRGYEEGVRDALRTLEASASEKGEMNADIS